MPRHREDTEAERKAVLRTLAQKSMGKSDLFKAQASHEKHEMAAAMGKTHGSGTSVVGVGGKIVDVLPRRMPVTAVQQVTGVDPRRGKPAAKFEEKRAFMKMATASGKVVDTGAMLGAYYSPDTPQPRPHIVTYGMYKSALRGGSAHQYGMARH